MWEMLSGMVGPTGDPTTIKKSVKRQETYPWGGVEMVFKLKFAKQDYTRAEIIFG